MINEIWKNIYGYNGVYQVSNFGRIYSKYSNKVLILKVNMYGYNELTLVKNNKKYSAKVHRLVAKAFIKNPKKKPQVNHKDGVKTNNHISNLEWVTAKENQHHAVRNNLFANGIKNGRSKFTRRDILEIKALNNYGLSNRFIAEIYNVVHSTIGRIINNKSYVNLLAEIKEKNKCTAQKVA